MKTNDQAIIDRPFEVKDHILEIAAGIFSVQGYRSTSFKDIARESGLNRQEIKQHFASKRDVFLALIGKYFKEYAELLEENHQRFTRSLDKGGEAFNIMRENTVRIFKYHARNPKLSRVIFRDAMALDNDYSWIVDELSGLIKLQMMDVLHMLKSNDIIEVSDLDMAATLMLGCVNATISEYILEGKKRQPEALADYVLDYFFRAMAPPGTDKVDAIRRLNSPGEIKQKPEKGPVVEVDRNVSVKAFFDKSINRIFQEQVRSVDPDGLRGVYMTLQFIIHGDEDLAYGLRIEDGSRMEIVHGLLEKAMITVEMSEEAYRRSLNGKLAEAMQVFINLNHVADRRGYEQIRNLKGRLALELLLEDGSVFPFSLTFNGAKLPYTVFRLSLDDYIAIGRGDLYGMSAFVTGRLDVEGDKPFAMQLSDLLR